MNSGAAARIRRAVHFFGSGVLDQVLLSAVSFLAGFVLIRFTDDEAYGQFVLANSTILLFQSAQGAWMSGPAGATAPKRDLEQRQLMLGSLGASQKRFLRRIVMPLLALPVAGFLLHICTGLVAAATAATIVASWSALERGWIRSLLLIYQRPADVLQADIVYAVVMAVGVAIVSRIHYAAGPWAICAMILASRAGELAARRRTDPGLRWEAAAAKPFWREMRPLGLWASFGAVTYWLFAQSYNYVLATRLDLTAVTAVNATRLVLMPVFVFTLGFNMLLTPVTANWLATSGAAAMIRKLALLTVAVLLGDLLYFAVMWPLRHWLITDLMRKTIADQDRLLILWACVAVIFLLREVLQAALFAMYRVKSMAWLMGASAVVSLSLMWVGIAWWGAAATLIGQVVGELINLVGLAWLLHVHVRELARGASLPTTPA